ncbi:MAG: hypothetical protein R3232_05620, partial [Clostridia bacterium]|nr:hypothetical protein [Clostridia bacterium]
MGTLQGAIPGYGGKGNRRSIKEGQIMKDVVIKNKFSEMIFNSEKGCVGKLKLNDGIKENDILAEPVFPVDIPGLICKAINIYDDNQKSIKINANYISGYHEVTAEYELYHSGYAVCTFSIKTTKDNDLSVINVGINLNKNTVFSSSHN